MCKIYEKYTKHMNMTHAKEIFCNKLQQRLLNFEQQDLRSVKQLAKECGWDCTEQEVMQASELCVVMVCRGIVHDTKKSLREQYDEIVEIYNTQPIITPKDSLSKQLQQYSTPAPLAFLAGLYVITNNSSYDKQSKYSSSCIFEPSAGNGLLTIAFDTNRIVVNEIDDIRLENLKSQMFTDVRNNDSSDPSFMHLRYGSAPTFSGVITNPPFATLPAEKYLTRGGKVGDSVIYYDFKDLDHKMAILALEAMQNDGKAAVIVGGKLNEEYHRDGRLFGRLKTFITYLNRQYNLEDVIYINGEHIYQRQSTTFPIILILINGRREWVSDKKHQWHAYDAALDMPIQTFDELFDRLSPRLTGSILQEETDDKEKRLRLAKAKIKIAKAKITIAEAEYKRPKLNDMGEKIGGSAKDRYTKGEKRDKSTPKGKSEKSIYLAIDWPHKGDDGCYSVYASYYKSPKNSRLYSINYWRRYKKPHVFVCKLDPWFSDLGIKYKYTDKSFNFEELDKREDIAWKYGDELGMWEKNMYPSQKRYLDAHLDEMLTTAASQLAKVSEQKAETLFIHVLKYSISSKYEVLVTQTPKYSNKSYQSGKYIILLSPIEIKEIFGKNTERDGLSFSDIQTYVDDHYTELIQKAHKLWDAKFGMDFQNKAGLIASKRDGKEWRNGKDATENDFLEVFGFRAVEFGETMPQKERKEHFNRTYDALMDLSEVCGFSPAAISLGGTLGICFGSRGVGGRGAASAHYELAKKVINLTRRSGAGSLAHEWFHALDHSLSTDREAASDRLGDYGTYYDFKSEFIKYITASEPISHERLMQLGKDAAWGKANVCLRNDTSTAMRIVVETLRQCPLYEASKKLDKARGGRKNGTRPGYWSQSTEMAARSFEFYVIEKLKEKGYANEYLAQIPEYQGSGVYPYPKRTDGIDSIEGRERMYVIRAFDLLFNTLTEVQGDIKNKKLNGLK